MGVAIPLALHTMSAVLKKRVDNVSAKQLEAFFQGVAGVKHFKDVVPREDVVYTVPAASAGFPGRPDKEVFMRAIRTGSGIFTIIFYEGGCDC